MIFGLAKHVYLFVGWPKCLRCSP